MIQYSGHSLQSTSHLGPEIKLCKARKVQTTGLSVLGGVYGVECIFYSVECTLYSLQCEVYGVQCGVYGVQCQVYCVQCGVYGAQCGVYT